MVKKPFIKKKSVKKVHRTESGRMIFPDKMRLWALIQADDYEQWIAAEVLAQTKHEAVFILNNHYGYPDSRGLLEGFTLTGMKYDKYLRIVELGGLELEYVQKMVPHEVREVAGLFNLE